MKHLLQFLALGAFGLGLAGCNGGNSLNTTPVSTPAPTGYKQIELLSRPAVKEVFETRMHPLTSLSDAFISLHL